MSATLPANISEETVRKLSEERGEPEWLLETRLSALAALPDVELPDVIQTPGRRWTNLEQFDFEELVDPLAQTEERDLVVPDSDVEVLSFVDALDEYEEVVRDSFGSVIDPERDYLTALSVALFSSGTLVYVPEGVDAEDVKIRTRMEGRSLFNH